MQAGDLPGDATGLLFASQLGHETPLLLELEVEMQKAVFSNRSPLVALKHA